MKNHFIGTIKDSIIIGDYFSENNTKEDKGKREVDF